MSTTASAPRSSDRSRAPRTGVCALVGTAAVLGGLLFAPAAEGVIVEGLVPMARPADGYVGGFNGSSCVAIAPRWFITAKHVGGSAPGLLWMRGEFYNVVEIRQHPSQDLQILRVDRDVPGYHRLAANVQVGDPCLLAGFGVTGGAALPNNAGYDWNGPRQETWGANTIEGVGNTLYIRFDPPTAAGAVPKEAIFGVNDSGGGLFVWGPDGSLRLAGVAVSVTGFGSAAYYNAAFAISMDSVRSWLNPVVDPVEPVSSSVIAPRAGVGLPWVPAWAGGAALTATLATLRRRRR
jgi:hypothetical protein